MAETEATSILLLSGHPSTVPDPEPDETLIHWRARLRTTRSVGLSMFVYKSTEVLQTPRYQQMLAEHTLTAPGVSSNLYTSMGVAEGDIRALFDAMVQRVPVCKYSPIGWVAIAPEVAARYYAYVARPDMWDWLDAQKTLTEPYACVQMPWPRAWHDSHHNESALLLLGRALDFLGALYGDPCAATWVEMDVTGTVRMRTQHPTATLRAMLALFGMSDADVSRQVVPHVVPVADGPDFIGPEWFGES